MAPNAQNQLQGRTNIPTKSKKKTNCNLRASEEIKLLTRYVILSMLGKSIPPPFKRAETMKRLVTELEEDNNCFFSNVCQQLDLSATNAYDSFNAVCDEIFMDQINWGRIVSYYAFSVKVAQYFQAQRQDWMEETVILWTHEYLAKLEPWIQEKGRGWEEFDRKFAAEPAKDAGSLLWKGFLVTATLGLGAFVAAVCQT